MTELSELSEPSVSSSAEPLSGPEPTAPSGPDLALESAFMTTLAPMILCWGSWSVGGSPIPLAATFVTSAVALAGVTVTGWRLRRLHAKHHAASRHRQRYLTGAWWWCATATVSITAAVACTVWRLFTEQDLAFVFAAAMAIMLVAAGRSCWQVAGAIHRVLMRWHHS